MSEQRSPMPLQDKIARLEDICRSQGLRMTNQRLEILRTMDGVTDHPSAETVHSRVRERAPNISLDTVYRTLATFERFGLVLSVPGDGDQQRYDPNTHPHHHMVCVRCKSIEDLDWPEVWAGSLPPSARRWGRACDVQVVVRGVCRRCLERDRN